MADLQVLDAETARMVEAVCDAIVPGSARVRPAVYIDALLARMDEGTAGSGARRFASLASGSRGAGRRRRTSSGCGRSRSRRSTATSSRPGVDATGAWEEIDFNTPLATRLAKDWSYLGIG